MYDLDSKILEVRDCGTHIPVLAIRMLAKNQVQDYYIHERCGYCSDGGTIMVVILDDGRGTNNPYDWEARGMGPRTLPTAHAYIERHFDILRDGDVVDVQFILHESDVVKTSERFNRERL